MKKAQINNSCLEEKIILRKEAIKDLKEVNVLDLFAGKKILWNNIKHDFYLGIDIKEKADLIGDNRKFIPGLDLSKFNVIDIDAYGIPCEQIALLFENKTLKAGTIFIFTFIQTLFGALGYKLLNKLGYSKKMIKKVPSLFNKNGFDKFKNVLSLENITEISYININNKYYGYFKS